MLNTVKILGVAAFTMLMTALPAQADAIRSGFDSTTFFRNDDDSVGPVAPGFNLDFFGVNYSSFFINNNGNITFSGPLSTYTPFGITAGSTPMIAPFFADVDTRGPGDPVTYGAGTVDGHNAFGINWIDVARYQTSQPLNSFQLVLIDRSDTGAGNFDIEFNYGSILWDTGSASGGQSAHAGWTNGAGDFFELPGSGVNNAFLDTSLTTGLIHTSNIGIDGRWLFSAREGDVQEATVPAPGALLLLGIGLAGLGALRRRRV